MPAPTAVANLVEISDLTGGYAPDTEEGSLALNQTPDALNLIPDPGSPDVQLRNGFTRLAAGRLASMSGYWIRHANAFEVIVGQSRKRYIVCVLTNGQAGANNIQIFVYDFTAGTFTRVDTAGRTWSHPEREHWGAAVEGTWYGGTRGEVIYSWNPTSGWNADPTTPSVKTWIDATNAGVNPATQFGRDYAFKQNQKVAYSGKFYSALVSLRYKTWTADADSYVVGDRVSRNATVVGVKYWRSYQCIRAHNPTSLNRPGDGTGSPTDYWKRLRLADIVNEDGDVSPDWAYMPLPGKGIVGVYHGGRLWVRHDDDNNWARLQYSAPAKVEKNAVIADLDWDPKDWAPVNSDDGDGGGWFTVPFAKADAIIGLVSYGNYLVIFGRWETFVLSGVNEQTWTLRPVGRGGSLGPYAHAEHDGIIYFLGLDGILRMTDGTTVQIAPGANNVKDWIKNRIDINMGDSETFNWHPALVSYGNFILISLPDSTGAAQYTLAYDHVAGAYWLWDIPSLSMTTGERGLSQRLWFSTGIHGQGSVFPCLFEMTDDASSAAWTDDDYLAASGSASTNDIPWRYRTAWVTFGATRNERRFRRIWAVVSGKAAQVVNVIMYRNFDSSTVKSTVNRTLVGQTTKKAEFIEGNTIADSYAAGMKLSGNANAQTVIHRIGFDTEPRRQRYHRGAGT